MAVNSNTRPLETSLTDAGRVLEARMLRQLSTGHRLGGTILWLGAPGTAKTAYQQALFRDVCATLGGGEVCDLNTLAHAYGAMQEGRPFSLIWTTTLADIEVVDVKGMALPGKNPETGALDRIVYTRSGILPPIELADAATFIFMQVDEAPAATPDHLKVSNQLFLDYRLGNAALDPRKFFVAITGNDVSHRSGATRILSHTLNRLEVVHIRADVRPWLIWSARNDSYVHPLGRAFVEMNPTLFTEGEVSAEPNVNFPTLRSFTLGMEGLMATYARAGYTEVIDRTDPSAMDAAFHPDNHSIATIQLSGYIGQGVATQFMSWARVREHLVPLSEILDDPEGARVPEDVGAVFAQASYITAWLDQKNAAPLVTYATRLRRDLRVSTIVSMMKKPGMKSAVTACRNFAKFATENHGLVMTTLAANA